MITALIIWGIASIIASVNVVWMLATDGDVHGLNIAVHVVCSIAVIIALVIFGIDLIQTVQ